MGGEGEGGGTDAVAALPAVWTGQAQRGEGRGRDGERGAERDDDADGGVVGVQGDLLAGCGATRRRGFGASGPARERAGVAPGEGLDMGDGTLGERIAASTRRSPYIGKDVAKARRAGLFVGEGSPASSTAAYAAAAGDLANVGRYRAGDVVFVSAEGARRGRFAAVVGGVARGAYRDLALAVGAGATIVVDVPADRERSYNVGEREVAAHLVDLGCVEVRPGEFRRPG